MIKKSIITGAIVTATVATVGGIGVYLNSKAKNSKIMQTETKEAKESKDKIDEIKKEMAIKNEIENEALESLEKALSTVKEREESLDQKEKDIDKKIKRLEESHRNAISEIKDTAKDLENKFEGIMKSAIEQMKEIK